MCQKRLCVLFVINNLKDIYRVVEREYYTVSLRRYTQWLDECWRWLVVENHSSFNTELYAQL
jgi:hypothetical protein